MLGCAEHGPGDLSGSLERFSQGRRLSSPRGHCRWNVLEAKARGPEGAGDSLLG